VAKPRVPSVSLTRQASGRTLLSLSKGAPAHAQHQDRVAIEDLDLIEDQRDGLLSLSKRRRPIRPDWRCTHMQHGRDQNRQLVRRVLRYFGSRCASSALIPSA